MNWRQACWAAAAKEIEEAKSFGVINNRERRKPCNAISDVHAAEMRARAILASCDDHRRLSNTLKAKVRAFL
jgi:hypothetical protein